MLQQVATLVIGVAVDAAVSVNMLNHILGSIAEEPLFIPVSVDNPVGVTEDVVIVLGLMSERVCHIGETNILGPLQTHFVAAIICPLMYGFCVRPFAEPF